MKEKKSGEVLVLIPELDFSEDYKANLETGKIYSLKKGSYLDPKSNRYGYKYTTFMINGAAKPYSIHSLIMSAGMGVKCEWWRSQGLEINHKKGKNDDGFYSLELVTRQQQYQDEFDPNIRKKMGGHKKLKIDKIGLILEQYIEFRNEDDFKFSKFVDQMATAFNVHYITIFNLLTGKTYKNITNGII